MLSLKFEQGASRRQLPTSLFLLQKILTHEVERSQLGCIQVLGFTVLLQPFGLYYITEPKHASLEAGDHLISQHPHFLDNLAAFLHVVDHLDTLDA